MLFSGPSQRHPNRCASIWALLFGAGNPPGFAACLTSLLFHQGDADGALRLDHSEYSMLADKWVREIHAMAILQALRSPASRVQREPLGPRAQKPNSAAVSDAHKQVEI